MQGRLAWGAIVIFTAAISSSLGWVSTQVAARPTIDQVEKTIQRMVLTRDEVRKIAQETAPYNVDRKLIKNQLESLESTIADLKTEVKELRTEISRLQLYPTKRDY